MPKNPKKTPKRDNYIQSQMSMFWGFTKKTSNMPRLFFDEKSKTSLGFEIRPRQQKLWRSPNVQLVGHPAVPYLKEKLFVCGPGNLDLGVYIISQDMRV